MSKLYIILGFKSGLSGGQIYAYNKTRYMEKQGWDVSVIDYITDEKIYIPYFQKFKDNAIPELELKPGGFGKKKRNKTVDKILSIAGYRDEYDEVIIESNTTFFALWGELAARRIGAKHFAMIIDAFFTEEMKKGCMNFFEFKLKRKELAGINKNALPGLFEGYRQLNENEKYYLRAFCTNSVENIEYRKKINREDYDFVIGSVGRIDKPFVSQMTKELSVFCGRHTNKKFLIILAGGSFDKENEKNMAKTLSSISNADVEITGLIYPIPLELLKLMDVNIASSGSATVTVLEGIKTIAVLDTCADPLGVIGYSIKGRPYEDYREYYGKLNELLDEVLFNDYCSKYSYNTIVEKNDPDEIFNKHINFIENSSKKEEYFETDKIKPQTLKQFIYVILSDLIGFPATKKMIKKIKGVFKSVRG